MRNEIFEKTSRIEAPIEEVFQWHARIGAIERYSPPWDPIKVLYRTGGIEKDAEVVIRMKAGPIPYRWHARHTDYEENRIFRDRQLRGPFSEWIHTHEFEPDGSSACFVRDLIQYRLFPHPLRESFSYKLIDNKLSAIFAYRHRTLKHDLRVQLGFENRKPQTVLISGASGLIGSALIPFLTTAGHKVIRLVRYQPQYEDEVFWDPNLFQIDAEGIEGVDSIIHLAGENIGNGRWSENKKEKILSSRIKGTRLIAETISKMKKPPKVFLSASAIGYYGDRGDRELRENDTYGKNFIAEVCRGWEETASVAQQSGIRTVMLRIGVVFDPRGGALERSLLGSKIGIKAGIASGKHYVSWIGLNDTIDAIYHAMFDSSIEGPLNIVAPTPVTSDTLSEQLARVAGGKLKFNIPESFIRLAFGQKGEEVLLSSVRVLPEKLVNSGFDFRHGTLPELLHHVLGKEN